MQKLRDYLDQKKIEWDDNSEEFIKGMWICRTHFEYEDYFWSVINGMGTYGGYIHDYEKNNSNLLELWVECVNEGEPIGFLKAEEVIKYIEDMKGKT